MAESSTPNTIAYRVNADIRATNPAPIQTALKWSIDYDGSLGRTLLLTQGVPSTPPNKAFLDRLAKESADPANTRYGALQGEPGLREALANDISTTYGGQVTGENVVITAGANMAAQVVLQALAGAGDEVILPSPWYFNHEMCLDELGIKLVPLAGIHDSTKGGFIPTVDDAEALIIERTRAIVLVTPNNPTGSIYSADLIDSFFDLCRKHQLALIIDETYRDFLAPYQLPGHRLFRRPDWSRTLISIQSFSKSYAIPGHRVGAIVASAGLLSNDISKITDVVLICAPVPAQKTLEWAISNEEQQQWRNERRDELIHRGQLFREVLNAANATISQERGDADSWPGWQIDGLGAYYAFVRHPYTSIGMSSIDVGMALAQKVGVVTLPAIFFGEGIVLAADAKRVQKEQDQQHLRFSIANILDDGIREVKARLVALDRLLMERVDA